MLASIRGRIVTSMMQLSQVFPKLMDYELMNWKLEGFVPLMQWKMDGPEQLMPCKIDGPEHFCS